MSEDKPNAMNPDGNFANFMMVIVAAPVVMAWVGLSIFLVTMAFNRPQVVQDIWTAQQNSQIEQTRKGTFRNGDKEKEEE